MEFESLKNELIENVKPHSPCASEYKRALNAWGNWSEENRKEFTSLENFDAEIFKEITGITV